MNPQNGPFQLASPAEGSGITTFERAAVGVTTAPHGFSGRSCPLSDM